MLPVTVSLPHRLLCAGNSTAVSAISQRDVCLGWFPVGSAVGRLASLGGELADEVVCCRVNCDGQSWSTVPVFLQVRPAVHLLFPAHQFSVAVPMTPAMTSQS